MTIMKQPQPNSSKIKTKKDRPFYLLIPCYGILIYISRRKKNNCSLNGVLLLYIHDTPNRSGEFSWIRSGTEKCKYSHFQPQIEVAAMRYDHFEVRLKHRALINVWCTNIYFM